MNEKASLHTSEMGLSTDAFTVRLSTAPSSHFAPSTRAPSQGFSFVESPRANSYQAVSVADNDDDDDMYIPYTGPKIWTKPGSTSSASPNLKQMGPSRRGDEYDGRGSGESSNSGVGANGEADEHSELIFFVDGEGEIQQTSGKRLHDPER